MMDDAQIAWLQGLVGGAAQPGCYPGLYRATVLDGAEVDPIGAGRWRVQVPAVSDQATWAATSRNAAGEPAKPGQAAWVMFEQGDPARPVVVGGAP